MKILLLSSLILIALLFVFTKKYENYNLDTWGDDGSYCTSSDPTRVKICCWDPNSNGNCWYNTSDGKQVWLKRTTPVNPDESHYFDDECSGTCYARDGNEIEY